MTSPRVERPGPRMRPRVLSVSGGAAGAHAEIAAKLSGVAPALILVFAAGAMLGAYHAGVEWKLWAGPTGCSGAAAAPAAVADFLKQLDSVTVVRCDEAALQVLGDAAGRTALDGQPPAAVPLFNGTPWFMPAVFAWMTVQDAVASRRRPA